MHRFSPEDLADWTGGSWSRKPVAALCGFATDTRALKQGSVFVALRTEKRDGHDFLADAASAGASAALVSRLVDSVSLPQLVVPDPLKAFQRIAREHRRRFSGPVVGITGSCGKTSTKDLLALLLGGAGRGVLATEGNLNNHIGVPLTLTRLDPSEHRFAVVEAGIGGPGEMDPLADMIQPDVGLVTLVAPAHLQELGGLEGVAFEKAKLPASIRATGVAIFPRQCAQLGAFRELDVRQMIIEPAEVLRPSAPPRDVVYFTLTQRDETTAISVAYGMPPPLVFTLRRISAGMAQNVVLAICAALWLNVSPSDIQARLSEWKPSHWRGEIIREERRLLYVDCYNANPASMRDALESFQNLREAQGPRLYVLGCMEELGPDATRYHNELGRSLRLRPEDRAFLVGSEADAIRAGLLEAGASAAQVEVVERLEEARAQLRTWSGGVFIKGSRKHRLETIFSDSAAAVACH